MLKTTTFPLSLLTLLAIQSARAQSGCTDPRATNYNPAATANDGLMIAEQIDPTGLVALIASIDGVKLRRPVVPGDQLRLEVDGIKIKERSASVKGVARVDGQLAAEAKIKFVMVEADQAA